MQECCIAGRFLLLLAMLNHVAARSRIKWPQSDGSNTSHYFSRASGADQQVLEVKQVDPRPTSGIRLLNFNRTFEESNILSLE